jgi:FAD/FMN-containing dehydrogenase
MPPAALEVIAPRQVVARFFGSPEATQRMVTDLGWKKSDDSTWAAHSKRTPAAWARIAVPRAQTLAVAQRLGERWWASPGLGIVNWEIGGGAEDVRAVRMAAEGAGGSLVIMAGPEALRREVGAWGTPPATLPLMRRLRDAFDPLRTINPGRFVV